MKLKFEWVEGTTLIATINGLHEVPCFRTCMIPGIAITYSGGGTWTLTHELEGRTLRKESHFYELAFALSFAEKHCTGIDWGAIKIGPLPAYLDSFLRELQIAILQEDECLAQLFDGDEED